MPAPTKTTTTNLTPDTKPVEALAILDDGYFESLESATDQPGQADAASPAYVQLYHEKTKGDVPEAMKAQGVGLNTFFLARGGSKIPLPTFQYHLLESERFWTKCDNVGKVIAAKDHEPTGDTKFSEHGFALILVKLPSGAIIPATFQARGGAYGCLKNARETFRQAKDVNSFSAQGDNYKVAATLPLPARFIATSSAYMTKSASSGNDYVKGKCSTRPSKIEDGLAFNEWWNKPDSRTELAAARAAYTRRVQGLKRQATEGSAS